ncbi:major facilitator superfamily domain-containing protein [Coniochaeta sp. 2T2.1]|nr:major facilitator superfamily domain-containing protein [Coniochaeta sp. 2T2.1]
MIQDRGSTGNARIMGLQKELDLSNDQYFSCLLIFFKSNHCFQRPQHRRHRYLYSSHWIRGLGRPFILSLSQISCFNRLRRLHDRLRPGRASNHYAKTYAHLLVARLVIGLGEATIQNVFVYMSVRTSYIFAFTPVAGAVSGLISYGIQRGLENAGDRRSWEWLFIIEGAATLVWAVVLWFIFPDMPDKELAKKRSFWFKDPEERRLIVVRSEAAHQAMGSKVEFWQMKVALKDPKAWALAIVPAIHTASLTGFSVFLPTFINEFGFSRLVTQLYTIIPYAVAFVSLLVVSRLVDHFVLCSAPLLAVTGLAIAGFIVLIARTNPAVGIL